MEKKNQEERRKGFPLFRMVVILLMVIIIALLLLQRCSADKEPENSLDQSVRAKLGQLEGKSEEEIQAELDRVVGEGMFHVVINPEPIFRDGTSDGNLEIENVPNNHYAMVVQILLQDTGEVIYDSGLINPNYHIQKDKLDVDLDAGEYPAEGVFYAYDMDSLEEVGNTSCEMTIRVQN